MMDACRRAVQATNDDIGPMTAFDVTMSRLHHPADERCDGNGAQDRL
jgi:hypothetical protein